MFYIYNYTNVQAYNMYKQGKLQKRPTILHLSN